MGRTKNHKKGSRKDNAVFKVAGSKVNKSKNKAKPVTTNLKKINAQTRTNTSSVDESFTELRDVIRTSKPNDVQTGELSLVTNRKKSTRDDVPDIGETTDEFSKINTV